jgi:xanthine dehydrogenase accessory factor
MWGLVMADSTGEISRAVLAALAGGGAVVCATVVAAPDGQTPAPGAKMLVRPDASTVGSLGGGPLEEAVIRLALEAIPNHSATSVYLLADGTEARRQSAGATGSFQTLIEVIEPPATLLVVGAGHIGRALAKFGAEVGFSVAVLDDRPDYADPALLPEADRVICADFEQAMKDFPINQNTYIVMVTRGHKQDELSLRASIGRGAAFVGMIGSRRRTGAVLQHLADEGFPQDVLDAVHTPIGIDIGAETPEEIAVSIIAELIMVRRGGTGGPMYYRRGAGQTAAIAQPAT